MPRDTFLLLTLSALACVVVPALLLARKAVQDRRNKRADLDGWYDTGPYLTEADLRQLRIDGDAAMKRIAKRFPEIHQAPAGRQDSAPSGLCPGIPHGAGAFVYPPHDRSLER